MQRTQYADGESLVLDLRRLGRWRRRAFEPPLDGWTANASPLEHNLMVTTGCPDAQCRAEAWAEHLLRCSNCARAQKRADQERGVVA